MPDFYDLALIPAALLLAAALAYGGRKAWYAIRAYLRARRVRPELAAVSPGRARVAEDTRGRARLARVPALPADQSRHRDPVIGVDMHQRLADQRQRFLRHLDQRGLCVDELRIETTGRSGSGPEAA